MFNYWIPQKVYNNLFINNYNDKVNSLNLCRLNFKSFYFISMFPFIEFTFSKVHKYISYRISQFLIKLLIWKLDRFSCNIEKKTKNAF